MHCPYCTSNNLSVLESRVAEDGTSIRRRRECADCAKRFTTYERIEGLDLKVLKKDGSVEQFDREKIKRGIVKATWKRPVKMEDLELLIDEVEQSLRIQKTTTIKSWEIGELVIERLKMLDPLGYLLFASVYRDFSDVDDFRTEIDRLMALNSTKGASSEKTAH
jgi:transcriptional repressor NrdR